MAGVCRRWGVCGQIAHLPWLNNGWMVIHKQTRGKISFNQNENSTEQGIANLVVNRCHLRRNIGSRIQPNFLEAKTIAEPSS